MRLNKRAMCCISILGGGQSILDVRSLTGVRHYVACRLRRVDGRWGEIVSLADAVVSSPPPLVLLSICSQALRTVAMCYKYVRKASRVSRNGPHGLVARNFSMVHHGQLSHRIGTLRPKAWGRGTRQERSYRNDIIGMFASSFYWSG
jgi:hypothetical protein